MAFPPSLAFAWDRGHATLRMLLVWLKGLAIGFGAGVVTMSIVSLLSDRASSAASSSEQPSPIARVQGLAAQQSAASLAPAFLDPPPSSETLPAEPAQSRRAEELAAINAVRASLIAKDPQAALAQLDRYELNYPEASFGLPAKLLRIEALAVSGRPQAAMALASAFVAAHPDSLHAARLRAFASGEALP